jgi:oligopeptide transport system substrate-binding protein
LKHLPRRLTWFALLVVFAMVVAACGDEAEETTTTAAPATTTTTEAGETTTTAPGETTTTTEGGPVTTLSGLRVIDDLTFEIELQAIDPEFPLRMNYAAYYPLPSVFYDDPTAFEEAPIGNGPFMMDGVWEHDVAINTVAYPDYAGPIPAQVDSLQFQIFGTMETAYQEALAGNLDICDTVPDSFLSTFQTDFPDGWAEVYTTSLNYLVFPTYLPEYTADVRRALSMAIDKDLITETIFQGFRDPAGSFIPANLAGARDYVCDYWTFKPEEAKALWDSLTEKPETITLWFNSGGGHENWMEAVVNMWNQNLGIDPATVIFETLEFSEYLPLRDAGEVTGPFRSGWGMDYPSPFNFLDPLFASYNTPPTGSNDSFYNNPEFDAALAEGVAAFGASGDLADAVPFYQQAEDLLCDDVQATPMFYTKAQYVWNESVDNVVEDAFGDIDYTRVTAADGSVSTYITEPEHLQPTSSNESEGVAVLRALFAPLITFDAVTGEQYYVSAESITTDDGGLTWTVTLKPGFTFHNGEPVTAASFVNAWNYGALGANAQQNNSFYATIAGYCDINLEAESCQ